MLEMKEPPASSDPRILPKTGTLSTDVHSVHISSHLKYYQVVKYRQVVLLVPFYIFLLFRPACPRLPGQYLSTGVVLFAKFRPGVAN